MTPTQTIRLTDDEARIVWDAVTSLRNRVGDESVQASRTFTICSAVRKKLHEARREARSS
jgi:gluconate kinase